MVTWSQRQPSLPTLSSIARRSGCTRTWTTRRFPPRRFRGPGIVLFDTVYHPENTMLLKLGREHQATTITGVEMFLRQAAFQFKIYTGLDAPLDVMRDTLKRKLGPLRDE